MKKVICLVILLAVLLTTACAKNNMSAIDVPDGVATPDYSDAEVIQASYSWLPSLTNGGLEHNNWEVVVADITINGWICEITDYMTSYYSAKVNDVLYGKLPRDTIVIEKTGNTRYKDPDYPLMEQNERLIVIIVKNQDAWLPREKYTEQTGSEPPEWMQETVVYSLYEYCDVVEDNGGLYVLDRNGLSNDDTSLNGLEQIEVNQKNELVNEVKSEYKETKSFSYPHAFTYDDFSALVEKYAPKN